MLQKNQLVWQGRGTKTIELIQSEEKRKKHQLCSETDIHEISPETLKTVKIYTIYSRYDLPCRLFFYIIFYPVLT